MAVLYNSVPITVNTAYIYMWYICTDEGYIFMYGMLAKNEIMVPNIPTMSAIVL